MAKTVHTPGRSVHFYGTARHCFKYCNPILCSADTIQIFCTKMERHRSKLTPLAAVSKVLKLN
jgi:hypothetical protein